MEEMPGQHHPLQYMQTHRLCRSSSSGLLSGCKMEVKVFCSPWFRGAWVFQSWDINREERWESSDECLLELGHMLEGQAGVTGVRKRQIWQGVWGHEPFHSSLFHAITFFGFFFFFLWAELFVSARINALRGLIISHTCHVRHLHAHGQEREEQNSIEQDKGASFEF